MTTATTSSNVARYIDSLQRHRDEALQPPEMDPKPPRTTGRITTAESSTFGLVELLLKDQDRLDDLARTTAGQKELIPRLIAIGVGGYAIFAAVLSAIFGFTRLWPRQTPMAAWFQDRNLDLIRFESLSDAAATAIVFDGSAAALVAGYVFGLVGAIGVCLPSFYFYGLLSGVRTSMLQVTTIALKGLAAGAVAVLGALPIYLAMMLGLVVFGMPERIVAMVGLLGLALPFVTGLYGTRALYRGFVSLSDTIPDECRERRSCFLNRLLFAWSACYTAVTPVMIYTIWHRLTPSGGVGTAG
jgi:hypothetical protein